MKKVAEKILFTSRFCSPCHAMKERLKSEGVDFKEVSVDTKDGSKLADKYNVKYVPSMTINGRLEEDLNKWFK